MESRAPAINSRVDCRSGAFPDFAPALTIMRIAHAFSLLSFSFILLIVTGPFPLRGQSFDDCRWGLIMQGDEESGEVEIDETDLDPILLPIVAAAMPPVD